VVTRPRRQLALSAAFVLLLLAVALLGQPLPALFAAVVAVPGFGIVALVFLVRRAWPRARLHLAKVAFYALLFAGTLWSNAAYERVSRARAQQLIGALERHVSEHGSLPEALDALVPAYLDEVPRPSSVPWGPDRFRYWVAGREFTLGYFTAGVVTRLYRSQDRTWRTRD
jgi:hypothetical protein